MTTAHGALLNQLAEVLALAVAVVALTVAVLVLDIREACLTKEYSKAAP
jgi:hypothetical protein